jgi:hypothetical protein
MPKMVVTKRDLRCLDFLTKYGVLSTSQINRSVFFQIRSTTVLRRLRKLEEAKLISRISGMKSQGLIWVATLKGAQRIGSNAPLGTVNRNTLNHDVQVSETRLRLEENGVGSNWIAGYVLKQRAGASVGKNGEGPTDVIPDALFSIATNTPEQRVAFEVELTPKSLKRYRKILSEYDDKRGIFRLWYLVLNEQLGVLLEDEWTRVDRSKGSSFLFWSLIPDILNDPFSATVRNKSHRLSVQNLFQLKLKLKLPAHVSAQLPSSEKSFKINSKISKSSELQVNQAESPTTTQSPSSLTPTGRFKEGETHLEQQLNHAAGLVASQSQEFLE